MDNNELIELDIPAKTKKSKRFLIAFTAYVTLAILFNVLSSYKSATLRINNEMINTQDYQFQNLIQSEIEVLHLKLISDTNQNISNEIKKQLITFYQNRNYKPVWIENFKTNQRFSTLMNLLDSAAYFGFPFDYFETEQLQYLEHNFTTLLGQENVLFNRLNLELTTTYSALKFILYLKHGILEQDTSTTYLSSMHLLPEVLNTTLISGNLRNGILDEQPNLVHHRNLLTSLSYFIDLNYSVKYTTPAFIDDKLLAKSLYYAQITEIPVFNESNTKKDALYALQDEYGLPHDSILNVPTHEVLVSLLAYKYYLACLNVNRLRKLKNSGENYLFVNIPEFKLHVVEANKEKESFNVIVGKKKTPTPVFSSNIEKVIANPYWTVPRSITFEMLHKIRKDSTYLERNGFFVINGREEVVDPSVIDWNSDDPLGKRYWLRQINSRYNALGQIKFIFPNEHSVYLHDTQSKSLFKLKNRTFSHGCVRLENPNKLAQYLTNKYTQQKNQDIENLLSKSIREEINLAEKVKIHIQYITCSATENADLVFYDDVYNLDNKEIKEVFPNLL
jgi:murein L,D-transpeptidase YcbB/YkuD